MRTQARTQVDSKVVDLINKQFVSQEMSGEERVSVSAHPEQLYSGARSLQAENFLLAPPPT